MSDKMIDLLNSIAKKPGTTVDHLWSVLIIQAQISAYYKITAVLVVAIAIVVARFNLHKFFGVKKDDTKGTILFVSIILSILGMVILYGAVTGLANPEYWAMQKLRLAW